MMVDVAWLLPGSVFKGLASSSESPTVTHEVACDLEAQGVDWVLVNSSVVLKLGVRAITLGQPLELLVEMGALIVLELEATVVVAVVLVVVTTLSEAVVTTGSDFAVVAAADSEAAGGDSSSLSLIVMTSGTADLRDWFL